MTHEQLLAAIKQWPEERREEWEERSALIAEACHVTREESERMAYEQMTRKPQ